MTIYDRGAPEPARLLEWDGGLSWIAHPDETGLRASHAIETDEGIWLVDPLDATNLDQIDDLGEVVGVMVCSSWHSRDAGRFANRYDVSVHIPEWMRRVEARVDAPVERHSLAPSDAFRVLPCRPFPLWTEAFLYHDASDTLHVADSMGTVDHWVLADERLGLAPFRRLQPPTHLRRLDPDRVLVGHGEPVLEDATTALAVALQRARSSTPRALVENGRTTFAGVMNAIRN